MSNTSNRTKEFFTDNGTKKFLGGAMSGMFAVFGLIVITGNSRTDHFNETKHEIMKVAKPVTRKIYEVSGNDTLSSRTDTTAFIVPAYKLK